MDFNSLLRTLGTVAQTLAPAIVPGATNLINAGKAVMEAFDNLKEANGGEAPADAEAKHRALVDKVNAHAEATFGRAEGGQG